jgi:hypothetical protein
MSRFFSEWGRLLVAPFRQGGWANVINFIVKGVVPLATASAFAALWQGVSPLPWWALFLIVLAVGIFAVTAGMAWEKVKEAEFSVGPLMLDVPMKIFYVQVRNGSLPAKFSLRVNLATDSSGVQYLERPWEGHWRGRLREFDGTLGEYEIAQYGLLGVAEGDKSFGSGNLVLFIYSRENGGQPYSREGHTSIAISRDVPLPEQGTTRLDVVISCNPLSGGKAVVKQLAFHVAPDPGSRVGYKIVAEEPTTQGTKGVKDGFSLRWLIDRVCTTFERIFGSRREPKP